MKKRVIVKKIIIVALLAMLIWSLTPRTFNQMKRKAYRELYDILFDLRYGTPYKDVESFVRDLKGPIIDSTHKDYVEFRWYKVLEWGDSAIIYIDVFRWLTSFSWRDRYFSSRITMNYQWGYLYGPFSKFEDILPNKYKDKTFLLTDLQVNINEEYEDSKLLIKPDRLFFFLKEGYFRVLDKQDDYTIVAFYQIIGKVFEQNRGNIDTIKVRSAKILINEANEVVIMPYHAPIELWDKEYIPRQ